MGGNTGGSKGAGKGSDGGKGKSKNVEAEDFLRRAVVFKPDLAGALEDIASVFNWGGGTAGKLLARL